MSEQEVISAMIKPYLKEINETPVLMSLLYDIDLMPEQIRVVGNAVRMIAFCLIFRKLTPKAIKSLTGGLS